MLQSNKKTEKKKEIHAFKLTCLSPTGIFTEYGCRPPPSPTPTDSGTSGESAEALTAERRRLFPERSERKLHLWEAAKRGKKRGLERRK
ncbi:hypothetical protein JHK85_054067 [Glycine max]|uniref:Uncharacterized protein n=1 Tax=Glycine max TaxID=3847 RepID=K7MXX6_SOYBN|nr:hypothetical protein JHK85_054067 [Glycine max]KAH1077401.1 hypothetical protein GYH30_052771 [Glycine max]